MTTLEEVFPHSGLCAWEVKWYFIHKAILPSGYNYNYLAAQRETDLLVVNWPEDEIVAVREDYCLRWFFVRVDGLW